MNYLASTIIIVLITVSGALVLDHLTSQLEAEVRSKQPGFPPLVIEEVKKGYLVVRNLGNDPARVDALYLYSPWGRELLASYKYPTEYEIPPMGVAEIPIPASLWGTVAYGSKVLYLLGDAKSAAASLAGPFLPQGGFILGYLSTGDNTDFFTLDAGLGSVYYAGMVYNSTNPQQPTMSLGVVYYSLDERKVYRVSYPSYVPPTNQYPNPMDYLSYFMASAVELSDGRILVAGPSLYPQHPAAILVFNPKTKEATVYNLTLPQALDQGYAINPAARISVSSLYHDPVTGRIYFAGYANVTSAQAGELRATVVGYFDLKNGGARLAAFWAADGSPLVWNNFTFTSFTQITDFLRFKPYVAVAGDKVFVGGYDKAGQILILSLDKELRNLTHIILLNPQLFAGGFHMASDGKRLYLSGIVATAPQANIPIGTPGGGTGQITVEVPPSPYVLSIDPKSMKVDGALVIDPSTCQSLCYTAGFSVGDEGLYLVVQDITAKDTIQPTDQYFYLVKVGKGFRYPQLYNLSLILNGSLVAFNSDFYLSIYKALYDDGHVIIHMRPSIFSPSNPLATATAEDTIIAVRPEVLEVDAAKGFLNITDPTTRANITLRLYNIVKPATNATIAQKVIGNVTILPFQVQISPQTLPAALFKASVIPGKVQPTRNIPFAIPLVFDIGETGSPLEAFGHSFPKPKPPILVPITPLPPAPPQPSEPITINVTLPGG